MADSKVVNEIEPPLLAGWLDGLDREFDRETEELMAGADRAIAWLRNHGRQKSTLPK